MLRTYLFWYFLNVIRYILHYLHCLGFENCVYLVIQKHNVNEKKMKSGAIRFVFQFFESFSSISREILPYGIIMAWHIAINRLHIQHVKLDMKLENKTTIVLILIFSNKNTFWNQRKSLKKDTVNLFVTCRKKNICHPSFYR